MRASTLGCMHMQCRQASPQSATHQAPICCLASSFARGRIRQCRDSLQITLVDVDHIRAGQVVRRPQPEASQLAPILGPQQLDPDVPVRRIGEVVWQFEDDTNLLQTSSSETVRPDPRPVPPSRARALCLAISSV